MNKDHSQLREEWKDWKKAQMKKPISELSFTDDLISYWWLSKISELESQHQKEIKTLELELGAKAVASFGKGFDQAIEANEPIHRIVAHGRKQARKEFESELEALAVKIEEKKKEEMFGQGSEAMYNFAFNTALSDAASIIRESIKKV